MSSDPHSCVASHHHHHQWSLLVCVCVCVTSADINTTEWYEHCKMPGCYLMVAAALAIQVIGSFSPSASHHHLQWLLHWIGQTKWLCQHVTGPHTNGLLLWGHFQDVIYSSHLQLILKRVLFPVLFRQQPGIFECLHQSMLHHYWLFIKVGCRMFAHMLYIDTKCNCCQNTSVVLLDFLP
jgi:hypothetical protein